MLVKVRKAKRRGGPRWAVACASALLAVAATLVAGASPAHAAPDAPTEVVATAGKRVITVNWTASTAPVHHYVATTTGGTAGPKTCTASSGATSCTISALVANTAYTVSVVACSTSTNTDCSGASTSSESVVPGPPNSPGKPTVAYTAENGEVAVSWTPSSVTAAATASFVVTPTPAVATPTGTCTSLLEADDTTCVIGGLVAGTPYSFKVIAVGVGVTGSSVASTASNSIIAGPPGKPGKPEVLRNDSDNELLVSWSAPTSGAPATSYVLTAVDGVDTAPIPGDCGDNPNLRSCVVTVDDSAVAHTFRVTAKGGGTSIPSDVSEPVAPGKPGVPDAPTVELTGPGNATVTWAAPVDGSPVDHYTGDHEPAV